MDRPDSVVSPTYLMVVQRGDEERYQLLRKLFQGQRVEVVWDRRTRERREAASAEGPDADRRAGDRRTAVPNSWVNLGFLVARRRAK